MKKCVVYYLLEQKRMLKNIPKMIAGLMAFVILVLGIAYIGMLATKSDRREFNVIRVGIVGGEDDKYTNLAVETVKKMETVRFSCEFDYCTEQKAVAGLKSGRYDVLFIMPEEYVRAFMHGENKTILVRFGKGHTDITAYVLRQLADVAAEILIQTEKNIYAMQDFYREMNLENEHDAVIDVNLRYFKEIVSRNDVFESEVVNATDDMSVFMYYFCDGIILIFIMMGLQCAGLLQRRDDVLDKKLKIAGLGTCRKLLARLAALTVTFFVVYAMAGAAIVAAAGVMREHGIVLPDENMAGAVLTLARISVFLVPCCMMILGVYEIVSDRTVGVFTLFILIIVLGMVSGMFYPISFLPKAVQAMSGNTVTRVMFCYVAACINGKTTTVWLELMALHSIIMFAVTAVFKKK